MTETLGTLNLKITRLQQRLRLLKQQQVLSQSYPCHQSKLMQEVLEAQFRIHQLRQYRKKFLPQISGYMTEKTVDGIGQREQSFYVSA